MDERQWWIRVTRGRIRRDLIRPESGRRRAPAAGLGDGAGARRRDSVGRVGLRDEAPRTRQEGKERARGVCWNCMSPARRLGMRMTAWRCGSSGLILALEAGTWPAAGRCRSRRRGGVAWRGAGARSPGRRWRGGEEALGPWRWGAARLQDGDGCRAPAVGVGGDAMGARRRSGAGARREMGIGREERGRALAALEGRRWGFHRASVWLRWAAGMGRLGVGRPS